MTNFRRNIQTAMLTTVAVVLFAGAATLPNIGTNPPYESVYNGHKIIYPASNISVPGRPPARITFSSTRTNRPRNLPRVLKPRAQWPASISW